VVLHFAATFDVEVNRCKPQLPFKTMRLAAHLIVVVAPKAGVKNFIFSDRAPPCNGEPESPGSMVPRPSNRIKFSTALAVPYYDRRIHTKGVASPTI